MAKWADYVIVQVRYNKEKDHIVAVRAREDWGDKLAEEKQEFTRQSVVEKIEKGTTFCTPITTPNGLQKGADVEIVRIDGEKFIRTDKDKTKKDNLGELPEF